ncbi:MAG TPA: GMC oxidoreductase [Acidimicrobiales bacterium]|nr:GMC oxidoreductase [Acidimicrobiales bacterium]
MTPARAYDVIVVGGGAAGCVVAARLAERGSRSVLLVEAGPDQRARPPEGFRDGWHITRDCDWGFSSAADERGSVARLWRTKMVGGTSWLTRFAVRGSPADFDGDMLPWFTKLEADADFGHEPWHGAHGPMPIDRYRHHDFTDVAAAALEACHAVGFPDVEDHNKPGAVGAGRMPMSTRDGMRVTTADAYLPVVSTPQNLEILADTHVATVVLDGTRARGVRTTDGRVIEAGWVALSAGAYCSPLVLMRSGIGPSRHLATHDIPVSVELPGVGQNLADHPAVSMECEYLGSSAREAPILHAIATFHSAETPSAGPPDLMLWLSDPEEDPEGPALFAIDAVLLKPESRGAVRLRSADPTAPPEVELPGLRTSRDVDRMAEACLRAHAVLSEAGVRRLCGELPPLDTSTMRDWVRTQRYSIPHVVGTCAIGVTPEDGAVVDGNGRVHGTEALSVIDASIIPDAPSGFPHVVTIMFAEQLAAHLDAHV